MTTLYRIDPSINFQRNDRKFDSKWQCVDGPGVRGFVSGAVRISVVNDVSYGGLPFGLSNGFDRLQPGAVIASTTKALAANFRLFIGAA